MTSHPPLPDEPTRAPLPALILLGIGAVAATTVLLSARGLQAASIAPTLEETQFVIDTVVVTGRVVSGHPHLPERFHGLEDGILSSPMLLHPEFVQEVERWTRVWGSRQSAYVPSYLARMAGFESMVDSVVATRDLPWSLRFLPVIESGYSPTAVSSAEAVGMWQFMAPTAQGLGVEVGAWVDDRRDPFVATDAAVRYLEELHQQFGSWFLALAAYNAGPDRVQTLIDRYLPGVEPSDAVYWALRRVLPKETAEFVPNLIGAIIVASAPEEHGYETPEPVLFVYDSVPVVGSIDFATIASAAGVARSDIEWLNPELVRGETPRGSEVVIRLPAGSGSVFRNYFAAQADR